MDGLDKLTRDDRFELLSAYIDNELSANERQQVEAWLDSDPDMRQEYQSLSALSRSFQAMPISQSATSADDMLDAVFAKVDRKPRLLRLAGMSAAVVAAIGALGALLSAPSFSPQMARQEKPEPVTESATSINTVLSTDVIPGDIRSLDTDSLMLVLDAPPVDIPVVAENTPYTDPSGL